MPSRFASERDYSQTFQYHYDRNIASLEAAAQRVDAQREAELAAEDALTFTKWQEGELSGGELLAYIQRRIRETSYDKAQQKQWREAAIEYGNAVEDERAEAEYARTGNINVLIKHYAGRLANAAAGTPERRELSQRLRSLREERDRISIRKQASKIQRQIDGGKKSTRDLIQFYRDQLASLPPNSPLRDTLRDTLSSLRNRWRQERFQIQMQKIDSELGTGAITPQEAAAQKQAVLEEFGIRKSSPLDYWKWQEQIRQLEAMPDPVEVERLELALIKGDIEPEEYTRQIEDWASRIAPFDQAAAWELRQVAWDLLQSEAAPLEEPGFFGVGEAEFGGGGRGFTGTIDVVKRLRGNAIKHITQMDGSKYSSLNCTLAAAAMLAHAMGSTGLTGADLRYLSGDTAGGTTIAQAQAALKRAGVSGTRLRWDNRISFERFKKQVANGAPAVLSGWLGDIPQRFNTSGQITGHGMFVAGYDPKRDAFLMLDPAKGRDEGVWWPASVVEDFGWHGSRHGQALLAPAGTIDPRTLKRTGGKVRHISVDAPPRDPQISWGGRYDPGPQRAEKLQDAASRRAKQERKRELRRIEQAGIELGVELNTQQEAEELIQEREAEISMLERYIDEAIEAFQEMPEEGPVTIVSTGEALDTDGLRQLIEQLIFLQDGQEMLWRRGLGRADMAQKANDKKAEYLFDAAAVNGIDIQWAQNRVIRDLDSSFEDIGTAKNVEEWQQRFSEIVSRVETLGNLDALLEDEEEPEEEGAEPSVPVPPPPSEGEPTEAEQQVERIGEVTRPAERAEARFWQKVAELVDGDYESGQEFEEAFVQVMSEYGIDLSKNPVLEGLMHKSAENFDLASGESLFVITGDQANIMPTKPVVRYDPQTGEPYEGIGVDLMVLQAEEIERIIGMGYKLDGSNLPQHIVNGADGLERVTVIPDERFYPGVSFLQWAEGGIRATSGGRPEVTQGAVAILDKLQLQDLLPDDPQVGAYLGPDDVDALDGNQISQLISANILQEIPYRTQAYDRTTEQGTLTFWKWDQVGGDGSVTTRWSETIPFVRRTPGVADILDHGYIGAELGVDGRPHPARVPGDESDDEATMGEVVQHDPDVDPGDAARERLQMQQEGLIPLVTWSPDPRDPTVPVQDTTDMSTHIGNPTTPESVRRLAEEGVARERAAKDKLSQVTSEEEASRLSIMTENELDGLFVLHGIDRDTGDWTPDGRPGDGLESMALLGLGGMTLTREQIMGEEPPPEEVERFDPLRGLRQSALGVARANQARKERALAQAAEAAEAARRAGAASPGAVTRRSNQKPPGYEPPDVVKTGPRPSPSPSQPIASPRPKQTDPTPSKPYDPLSSIQARSEPAPIPTPGFMTRRREPAPIPTPGFMTRRRAV